MIDYFNLGKIQYTLPGTFSTRTRGAETTVYRYDELGNLLGVTLPDGREIGYIVDRQGRRVGKTVGGSLVRGFLYQDLLRPVAELDGTGAVVSRFHLRDPDNLPEYLVRGGRTYLFVADHLGSPRLVVDAETGAVAQQLWFNAYGNVVEDTNPGFQPFGFAGGLYDPDTGLVRFGLRDYTRRSDAEPPRSGPLRRARRISTVRAGRSVNLKDPTGLSALGLVAWGYAYGYFAFQNRDALSWFVQRSPWLVGFADGYTGIPFTGTSVSGYLLERMGMNDRVDRCSYRYRAGRSMGESFGLLKAGFGLIGTSANALDRAARTAWRELSWGDRAAAQCPRLRTHWKSLIGVTARSQNNLRRKRAKNSDGNWGQRPFLWPRSLENINKSMGSLLYFLQLPTPF